MKELTTKKEYINWENAGREGRVPTVSTAHDTRHFRELSPEEQYLVKDWIRWNFYAGQKVWHNSVSTDFAQIVMQRTGVHISNNQFKEAMLEMNFYPYREEAVDWEFYLRESSPALKMQIDGHPGLPVIGSRRQFF